MDKTNPTPNPMTVLDHAHVAFSGNRAREIYEARAAVAELIEAARGALRNKPFARSPAGQRLSAALAKLGPAS